MAFLRLPGQRIELIDSVHFVAEELDPDAVVPVGRNHLDHVPPDPEGPPGQIQIGPLVLDADQPVQQRLPGDPLALAQHEQHPVIGLGRPQAVDAAHAADDDAVPALEQGSGRRMPQPVDIVVDQGLLLDVGVGGGDVRFRLVVVVVADEVLHRVFGEEIPELLVELGGQRLVVAQDQGGPIDPLDDLGHGEGLAGPGDSQQHLAAPAFPNAPDQLLDGPTLIPAGRERTFEPEPVGGGRRLPVGHTRVGDPLWIGHKGAL